MRESELGFSRAGCLQISQSLQPVFLGSGAVVEILSKLGLIFPRLQSITASLHALPAIRAGSSSPIGGIAQLQMGTCRKLGPGLQFHRKMNERGEVNRGRTASRSEATRMPLYESEKNINKLFFILSQKRTCCARS
jgi:hypothetical protein